MFLNTALLDEAQNTYELEGSTTLLIHLWCGKCGVPTGSTGCNCYRVPKFTTRTARLALNDYDEALTDYSTETGYVIAPESDLDQTPVFNLESEQNQPHEDFYTWQGLNPREEKKKSARVLESASSIADRFHPELMMNLKTLAEVAEAMYFNPRMKICKKCGYQQHYTTQICAYC